MRNGVVIGVAVGAGYLLGRSRKLKLVMTLVDAGASGRLSKNPAGLVKQGTKLLGSSPELKSSPKPYADGSWRRARRPR
jgi:hypothetical protein